MFKQFGLVILRNDGLIDKDQLVEVVISHLTGSAPPAIKKKASYAMGSIAVILRE